eukprot:139106-Chlamydomonas_euryale.AAC.3
MNNYRACKRLLVSVCAVRRVHRPRRGCTNLGEGAQAFRRVHRPRGWCTGLQEGAQTLRRVHRPSRDSEEPLPPEQTNVCVSSSQLQAHPMPPSS